MRFKLFKINDLVKNGKNTYKKIFDLEIYSYFGVVNN